MSQGQRFCPLCDQIFAEGEAVLRCKGCGVMHHPACWVRNDGCATSYAHEQAPLAQSYTGGKTTPRADASPAEGVRVLRPTEISPIGNPDAEDGESEPEPQAAATAAVPLQGPTACGWPSPMSPYADQLPERKPATEDFVIGSAPAADRLRASAPYVAEQQPAATRKQAAGGAKPMPAVYQRHPVLAYWYVPVAIVLAALVAAGVIFAADALFGDDESEPASVTAPTATPEGTPTTVAAGSATPAPSPTPGGTTPASATFQPGDQALVTGTGNCLNVRSGAGTDNDVVTCADEGTTVTILGGPTDDGEFVWWNIETPGGAGWAAEEYLVPAP